MNERIISKPPSGEDLSATYKGISWEEFSNLTDDQVEHLRAEKLASIKEGTQELGADKLMDAVTEVITFRNFSIWRKHGIPDREVTAEELVSFVAEYVNARIANDPEYGEISKDDIEKLTDDERFLIMILFGYFEDTRDMFEYFIIDDYSLYNTLGLEEKDITFLLKCGVIKNVDQNPLVGNIYELVGQYYDYLLRHIVKNRLKL